MTAEQKARDMLERMGVEDAQSMTAGDLVELANLIAYQDHVEAWQREGEAKLSGTPLGVLFWLGGWWADRPWRERA